MINILSPLGSNPHLQFQFILLLSCLQSFIANCQSSPSQCYYNTNGTTFSSPDYVAPCGKIAATSGFLSCCDLGAQNICLSNNICYDPNRISGQHYYLSPCTDASYTASQCPQYCSNRPDKDMLNVIYDYNAQLWRCCASNPDDSTNCTNPTDETFDAPPPESLSVEYPASATNPAVSASVATVLPGHIAGIVIGAAVGFIIISVSAVLYFRRRWKGSSNPSPGRLLNPTSFATNPSVAEDLPTSQPPGMQQSGYGRLSPPNHGDDP